MKKPFFIMRGFRDTAKLIFCIVLTFAVISLFFDDVSVVASASGGEAPKSLFGLLSRMVR